MTADLAAPAYPARLRIDYPEQAQDRVKALFRLILAIPIVVLLGVLIGGGGGEESDEFLVVVVSSGGVIVVPVLLMILFRRKYPRWWFDWNLELTGFFYRVTAYLLLLREEYPSTDEEQAVRVELDYPEVERDLNRWLPLVKWLLAIPHYVVLIVLATMVVAITVIAWFAILVTGRYPRELFTLVVGWSRWALRVSAYAFLLTTDRYPPFSFEE